MIFTSNQSDLTPNGGGCERCHGLGWFPVETGPVIADDVPQLMLLEEHRALLGDPMDKEECACQYPSVKPS